MKAIEPAGTCLNWAIIHGFQPAGETGRLNVVTGSPGLWVPPERCHPLRGRRHGASGWREASI